MFENTYSQEKQDLRAIEFFNEKQNLFFLDIGANEGIKISNTYLLEKKYSWKGICSEPIPDAFNQLKENRNVICDNNAVYSESNLQLDFSLDRWLSGITTHINSRQRTTLSKPRILVNTITLQDLLQKYNAPLTIHYMSLDTEGSEYEILKSVNLKQYKFLYICVEHNFKSTKRSNIYNLLINNGYIYKGQYNQDDEYIHEDVIIGKYSVENEEYEISKTEDNKFKLTNLNSQIDEGILVPRKKYTNLIEIMWNKFGICKIYYDCIVFENGITWNKKSLIL